MSEKILVPALGESITEATVVKWLKSRGESVGTDEPIVELETDKCKRIIKRRKIQNDTDTSEKNA